MLMALTATDNFLAHGFIPSRQIPETLKIPERIKPIAYSTIEVVSKEEGIGVTGTAEKPAALIIPAVRPTEVPEQKEQMIPKPPNTILRMANTRTITGLSFLICRFVPT